jgi:hypothetical protein
MLIVAATAAIPLIRSGSNRLKDVGVALVVAIVLTVVVLDWKKVHWRPSASSLKKNLRERVVAVAAVLAAAGTVATAVYAEVQLGDLRQTRQQDQAASLAAQRRAQAEEVSAWPYATDPSGFPESKGPFGKEVTYIELINTSGQPVYQAVVSLVIVQGAGPRTGRDMSQTFPNGVRPLQRTLAVIPPGTSWTYVQAGWAGMFRRPGAELAFTDQGGRTWVRWAWGGLTQIHEPAAEYYQVPEPAEWATPQTTRPH